VILPKKEKPEVLVSAAALFNDLDNILLTLRPEGKSMAGLWEFPGGKVRSGELIKSALIRELSEELNISVNENNLFLFKDIYYEYNNFYLLMILYCCWEWEGSITPMEGQKIIWTPIDDLSKYKMPPADLPLVSMLQKKFLCKR